MHSVSMALQRSAHRTKNFKETRPQRRMHSENERIAPNEKMQKEKQTILWQGTAVLVQGFPARVLPEAMGYFKIIKTERRETREENR